MLFQQVRREGPQPGLQARRLRLRPSLLGVHRPQQALDRPGGPAPAARGLPQEAAEGPAAEIRAEQIPEGPVEQGPPVRQLLAEEAAALEGAVLEHLAAEAVDGGEGGAVEAAEGPGKPFPGIGRKVPGAGSSLRRRGRQGHQGLQHAPHPGVDLQGGLLGEGHHQDLLELRPLQQQVHHQPLQGVGLAGAGAGLDHAPQGGELHQDLGFRVADHGCASARLQARKSPSRARARATQSGSGGP